MPLSRIHKLLTFAILLLVTACARQSAVGDQAADVSLRIKFDPNPPVVGEGKILLEVTESSGQPVDDLDIQVKGDMTHAGMTPVFGISEYDGDGQYSVPFEWTMAGDWILQVGADLPDGRLLNRSFEVRVTAE